MCSCAGADTARMLSDDLTRVPQQVHKNIFWGIVDPKTTDKLKANEILEAQIPEIAPDCSVPFF